MGKKGGNDGKFFASTNRKGENQELQEELRSPQRDRKRDAVKKVSGANIGPPKMFISLTFTFQIRTLAPTFDFRSLLT